MAKTIHSARNEFDERNREAAELILAQPEKYSGLPLAWARMVLARPLIPLHEATRAPNRDAPEDKEAAAFRTATAGLVNAQDM